MMYFDKCTEHKIRNQWIQSFFFAEWRFVY